MTDEELIARLGDGAEDALRTLHQRYAALVFSVAARIVDPATAEDVVQDVFVTLWKKHETFDPARGGFKSWIVQIARRHALNEHRRNRKPNTQSDRGLDELSDDALEPDDAQWIAHRRAVIRAAVDALPDAQRQALSLAFFDELTHEQIAATLRTPLGTTKTRIRVALRRLAPVLLAVVAVTAVVVVLRRQRRDDEALRMLTASDLVPLRLEPTADAPPLAHGSYRARPGARVAVLTTTNLLPTESYVAWAHHAAGWHRLGPVVTESDGRSLLVVEVKANAAPPDEIRVTREASPSDNPRGPVVLTSAR